MHWDRLFEDLEGQLASEWEAERAALDAESERLRISRIELAERLRALSARRHPVVLELSHGERVSCRIRDVGADWVALESGEHGALRIAPMASLAAVAADHGALLSSLEPAAPASQLRSRMTLGFVLRDLSRRRLAVTVTTMRGDRMHGTIDRAGADHLDLAVHDPGEPRRAGAVREFRMVPMTAIGVLQVESAGYDL